MQFTDFEISLHRRSLGAYSLEIRFNLPEDEADHRVVSEAKFDFVELRALEQTPIAYGQKLSEALFVLARRYARRWPEHKWQPSSRIRPWVYVCDW